MFLLALLTMGLWYNWEGFYFVLPIGLMFFLLMLVIQFKDYKIILDEEGLELYSIYREKIRLYWTSINKIEVKKSYPSKLTGYVVILTIYTYDGDYKFNIYVLDDKEYFFRSLINKCATLHIHISDLTSDEMIFFINMSRAFKKKVLEILNLTSFRNRYKKF